MESTYWKLLDRSLSYCEEVAAGDCGPFLEGRNMSVYSVAWRSEVEQIARHHLLQHFYHGHVQEDIALATWYPADGNDRYTAIIDEVLIPAEDERILQGNVQMTRDFLRRCRQRALSKGAGMAVMHNHLRPGWQRMSKQDIVMESRSLSNPARATGLPALGLTLGTDGTWSARFWLRTKAGYKRQGCSTVRIVSPAPSFCAVQPLHRTCRQRRACF